MGTLGFPQNLKKIYFNILILVIISIINTSNAGTCKEGCPSSITKFGKYNYAPGSIYSYDIDSTVTVHVSGKDAQETQVRVQGTAQLFVEGNCDYSLKLMKLSVTNPDGKQQRFSQADLSNPVRFILSEDEVTPEICSENGDNEYLLNIKKAIISALQSADHKPYETDIFGTCPTISSVTSAGGVTIVSKVRNLNLCSHRETLVSGFITSVVNEDAGLHASPLLNGDYSNEQRIRNGVLESSVIYEEYNFVPFSAGESSARAKVQTVVKLSGTSAGQTPKIKNPQQSSIIFESPTQTTISNLNNVKTVLKNTLSAYTNNVGSNAAAKFTDLIRIMRLTTSEDLRTLYQNIKSKSVSENVSLTRKIYFDALFRTGTAESVEVCATLLKSGELNDEEKKLVYLSLNLVHTMTRDALNNVNKLLDGNPPKEAYLTVGNLVARYCRKHSCESNEIKSILDKFNSKLGNCKADNRQQEDIVVAVLKGIRNTENLMGTALDRVVVCTSDKSLTRIRVAAIQALTAAGTTRKAQNTLLNLLKNVNEDSELRIEAYLALVSNPVANVANEIKNLIDTEPIYQVGSFITTHLASLRASVDPTKSAAKQVFGGIHTTNKFPKDFRKYSFNHEFSYAVDSLGMGASFDTNVIYSQKSFIPRSGSFNFTGEVFGNAFNVFEVSARQENLDYLLESYFGPKGFFHSSTEQEIYNKFMEIFMGGEGETEKSTPTQNVPPQARNRQKQQRQRRGIKEDALAFAKTVNMGNEANNDLDLDFSMKIFGSEMFFLSLGHFSLSTPDDFIRHFKTGLMDCLHQSENYNKIFENHALFLDADLVYPTSVGFPIKLHAQGSSVVRIETKSLFNLDDFKSDAKNINVQFKFVPSANIYVSGTLSFDAYLVNAGIQVNGALQSSTGFDLIFSTKNQGQEIDVDIKMPLKKQEILTFDHKVVFIQQEKDRETVETPLKFTSKVKDFKGCFDQLYAYIGVTFCGDVAFTVPGSLGVAPFPLNGPNRMAIYLEVDDAFKFNLIMTETQGSQNILLGFDTPGSQINRKTTLEFETGYGKLNYIRTKLASQFKNALAEAGVVNDDEELSFYGKAKNEEDLFLGKVGFRKQVSGSVMTLTPIILVQSPGKSEDTIMGYKVEGQIILTPISGGTKYTFNNIHVIGGAPHPLAVNGDITYQGRSIKTDLKFTADKREGNLDGLFEYSTEPISVNFDLKLQTNIDESMNGRIAFIYNRGEQEQKTSFIAIYGSDFESQTNRIEYTEILEINDRKIPTKIDTKIIIGFLPAHLKYALILPHENEAKFDFDVKYTKYSAKADFHLVKDTTVPGAYDLSVGAGINERSVKFISKLSVENEKNVLYNKFTTSIGLQAELKGTVGQKFSENEMDVDLTAILILDEKTEPYKLTFVATSNPKLSTSNSKFTLGKQELASYDIKVTKAQVKTIKADFTVKGIFVGKADFKVQNNNKGEGFVLFNLQKAARKLRTDVKFNVELPTFDVSTDFYYDWEKDNNKKISFSTKSKIEQDKFDSKNSLDVFNEIYTFNAEGTKIGQIQDGTIIGKFVFTLPTGRSISSEINREAHLTNLEQATGNFRVTLNDRLPNKQSRDLELSGIINKGNFRARIFDVSHTLKYTDLDKKVLELETNIKNLPKGSNAKQASINLLAKGNLLSQTVELNFGVDEYDSNHANYHLTGKYGNHYSAQINGGYDMGARLKPMTYSFSSNIDIPAGKIKSLKFETTGKLLKPETSNGDYSVEFTSKSTIDDKAFSFDTKMNGNDDRGHFSCNILIPDVEPFKTELNYVHEEKDDTRKCSGTITINYGKDKFIIGQTEISNVKNRELSLIGSIKTPFKNAENVEYNFNTARSIEGRYTTNAHLTTDGKSYGWKGVLLLSNTDPEIDIDITYPEKTMKFYTGFKRLGPNKHKGELIVKNIGKLDFDGKIEVSYDNLETFYLTADVDSETLKLSKIHAEINSKPGSGGKGVVFKITSDGNNILDGSTDFTVKEERGKTTIQGVGNVKLYDKQNKANFNFVRTNFDMQKDGETGVLLTLNANFGPKKVTSELKMTDRNFHVKHNVCEDKTKCINMEMKSQLTRNDVDGLKHSLDMSVDLRQIGYEHVFGLDSKTERKGIVIDHTFNIYLMHDNQPKYQYQFYLHPKQSGMILTIPSRVIAIESTFNVPQQVFGKYDTSVAFYPNKLSSPDNKALIGFGGELNKNGEQINGKYEFAIKHRDIKPLIVTSTFEINPTNRVANGRLEFDIFKTPQQKIIVSGNYGNGEFNERGFNTTSEILISSSGLNLDIQLTGHTALSYDRKQFSMAGQLSSARDDIKFSAYTFASPQLIEFIITGFNEELINAYAKYDIKKHVTETSAKIKFLGSTPVTINSKITSLTSMQFDLTRGKLLKINGELTAGKEGNLEIIGSDKQLFKGKVQLDQNHFLASEYKVQDEEVKQFLKVFQDQLTNDVRNARTVLDERVKKTDEIIRDKVAATKLALPDFERLKSNLNAETEQITNEFLADPTIKEILQTVTEILKVFNQTFQELMKIMLETFEKISKIVLDFYGNLQTVFTEKILPSLKELYQHIEYIIHSIYEETFKLLSAVFERTIKSLKEFEDDFNKIGKTFGDMFKNIAQAFNKYIEIIQKEINEIIEMITNTIKNYPGFEKLEKQYHEIMKKYHVPEQIVALMKEMAGLVKYILPTPEVNRFVDQVVAYLEAKLTNTQIDDAEIIKQIYLSLIDAIKSILKSVSTYAYDIDPMAHQGIFAPIPISLDALKNIPMISSMKFSPINYLRSEKPQTLREILTQYRPYSFDMQHFLPPFTMHGQISDGEHYFTFDNRHFTFSGDCSYILAQDFINNNFSLIASLANGKMKSITLVDKGDFIEINDQGLVTLNGRPAELPVHQNDIHAWRNYYSVNLLTRYGVRVLCSSNLRTCHVSVSGYYLGKVRGLLGNGNGEPYDDFILPNNKITDNYADFGNAYKSIKQNNCKPVEFVNHAAHHHHGTNDENCKEFFSSDSPLKMCFYFIDPTNYREACEHAAEISQDKFDGTCNIVKSYVSACRLENIPITIPTKCDRCERAAVGETYTTKVPHNQADIVIVADTSNPMILTDVTQSLITDLRAQLKQRDITDAKITVIGYNKNQKYISLFTDKGKLDYNGKLQTAKLNGPEHEKPIVTGNEHIDAALVKRHERKQHMLEELSQSADAEAFQMAFKYPFRSTATKVIIAVRGDSLQYSANPVKILSAVGTKVQVEQKGIALHLVTPIEFSVTKDQKTNVKNIVGFNNKIALTTTENKKRTNFGSTELRNSLKFQDDLGIDLVQDSNGYVYSLTNYLGKAQKERKPFMTVIAASLADQISRTEIHSECVCRINYGLFAEEDCKVVSSKLVAAKKVAGQPKG